MTTPTQTDPLQLSVSNFGPIAKAEVDLRPLTVFVGPSNTGKSYLAILIYALHRFFDRYLTYMPFGFMKIPPTLRRIIEEERLFDGDNAKRLADWIKSVLVEMEAENLSEAPPIQLPDFMMSTVHSLFSHLSDYSEVIAEEIERSFGIESTTRLIRHGNRAGAKITLRFKPFAYELALKRGRPEELVTSISKETPLYINPHTERTEYILQYILPSLLGALNMGALNILGDLNILVSGDDDRARQGVEYLIEAFLSWILSDVVSPLNDTAHYLPTDRTGVMHAHRVVSASLIERAPRAGLQRDTPLPALSGVLADFLKQLVGLGEPSRQHHNNGNLAANLEQHILKGEIHSENSESGYPMFSYQPQGWGEDLPLMNTSSMVSELAPVVLYLRHIVQPGDVLIIEEPESHLHPAMQVEFLRQLAAVVHAGIRVILTTHSEWVLDELANLVRLSELPKTQRRGIAGANFALSRDQVGVWLFEPKQRPRGSVVKEIPCDVEFGGFRSGFDDVALGTYNDYAEISNRIERSGVHGKSR